MRLENPQLDIRPMIPLAVALAVAAGGLAVPRSAEAFCGFYVSQSGASLYANATRVAMMRDGQQTVMSMQNNYSGPPEDFAMVVPVPEVLEKEKVKTLEDAVFDRLDQLTAPRLVEYWQHDPCARPEPSPGMTMGDVQAFSAEKASGGVESTEKVTVEAQFDVAEYEIVVLSAEESNALDKWLKNNEYNIPDGAPKYFRPYIQKGVYFFVAKVNLEKVEYADGEAILSPLRFHYEEDDFKLPVRLGLINSQGSQDLIVYLLGRNQRYRVANYPNVTMPTNLPVSNAVKGNFATFYDTLFSRVRRDRPKSVVTEYAWTATSCDPCPVEPLNRGKLKTLGADVIGGQGRGRRGWTVTRLHTRYSEDSLGQDLVFEEAPAIKGGRGEPEGGSGEMDHQDARRASRNNFQSRYYIRHFWSGAADCQNPNWGRWGGPPGGTDRSASSAADMGFRSTGGSVDLGTAIQQESVPKAGKVGSGADDSESDDKSGGSSESDDKSSKPSEVDDDESAVDEDGDVDLDEAVEQEEIPGVEEGE